MSHDEPGPGDDPGPEADPDPEADDQYGTAAEPDPEAGDAGSEEPEAATGSDRAEPESGEDAGTDAADADDQESGDGAKRETPKTETDADEDDDGVGAASGTDRRRTPDRGSRSEEGRSIGQRVRALFDFDHQHTTGTKVLVLAFAVLLGLYASWLLADLRVRTATFLVITGVGTYSMYARPTRRDVVVRGLYSLAILLVLTPVMLNVTFLLLGYGTAGIDDAWAFVFTTADLIYLVVFGILAAIPAGIAFLLDRRR